LLDYLTHVLEFSEAKTDSDGDDTNSSLSVMESFQFVNVLEKIMENGSNNNSLKAAGIIENYSRSKGSYKDIFLYSGGALWKMNSRGIINGVSIGKLRRNVKNKWKYNTTQEKQKKYLNLKGLNTILIKGFSHLHSNYE